MGQLALSSRIAFNECTTTDDLRRVVEEVVRQAQGGDLKAAALVLRHCFPAASRRNEPIRIDPKQLETVDGCIAAHMDILREVTAGAIDHETASILRASVDSVLRAHAVKAGDEQQDNTLPVRVIVQSYNRSDEESV